MKKVLLFAAVAAIASGAFADAQIYEMTITVKTTVSAHGSITPVVCDTPTDDTGLYRKQSTVKIKGLIWGCDCETIADPIKVEDPTATYGYIFWNETTRRVIDADFSWKTLNRIDKKLNKAEGAWKLADTNESFCLVGGGFGKIKDTLLKSECKILDVVLTPMSGNVAGWMSMPTVVVGKGTDEICKKCEVVAGSDDVVARAPGWSLCYCGEGSEFSAVTGTWKLKYVKAASAKWGKVEATESITKVYSFPSYVASYIESLK
ncbi:MAG: hypothetical protein ILO34_06880 [Kiritimatiellae bacterium]|nr:hypothetical protein [Kiritimatiellia bacterium]